MALKFSEATLKKVDEIIARYPNKASALMPVLYLAQDEFGYISDEAKMYVADLLDLPPAKVYCVSTFYSMYKNEPTGRNLIQICTNLSCSLLGAEHLRDYMCGKLGIEPGGTSNDGKFSLVTMECLGGCGTAPVMMVNRDYYENLNEKYIDEILNKYD